MLIKKILKIALNKPIPTLFDYLPPKGVSIEDIPVGVRVRVPFGRTETVGFVTGSSETKIEKSKLKEVISILDSKPLLPSQAWFFSHKAHLYYHHPLGEVLMTGLPKALREGKPCLENDVVSKSAMKEGKAKLEAFALSDAQKTAISHIEKKIDTFEAYLLDGVTGSGKTEVYLQVLSLCQKKGKSALLLLPEISLTPQTLKRFENRIAGNILLYHSKLTPKARYEVWSYVRNHSPVIVIGTRSALFLPFDHLGAIIVDEEHDASFKQQEGFKYSARDLAVLRANLDQCPVLLGSATPSFETLYNVAQGKYQHLKLPQRVNQSALPCIQMIDVRHKKLNHGLSASTLDTIKKHLAANQQVLIFLNRRGYSPAWMCFECSYTAECERCDAKLIYHHKIQKLRCHHCDKTAPLIQACPTCQNPMQAVGIGTQRLEETLMEAFPNVPLLRIDSDTTKKKGALESMLQHIEAGGAQLLVGTQLLAKGHHFPMLTLVVIVDVDSGLFSTDFRAVERMGQLVTQVAGRAGREGKTGEVILQTFQPHHPLLQCLIHEGYAKFAQTLLEERQQTNLPPFSHLALVRAQAKNPNLPEVFLEKLKNKLSLLSKEVGVWGPSSALMSKKQGFHRYQLVLQAKTRSRLHELLRELSMLAQSIPEEKKVRWSLDVDPIEMS